MELDRLVERYPRIYHMAERDSWLSIRKFGLLSTTATMELLRVDARERNKYVKVHRPEKVVLRRSGVGSITLRDQKPMSDERLTWCLQDGLSPEDWYQILNEKVFFWAEKARLLRLLGARAYRSEEHDVLTIDAAPLVRKYVDKIRLAHMNTGNTFPYPAKRGRNTFKTIAEYATKRDGVTPCPEVVELVVEHSVPDIAAFVLSVDRMKGPNVLSKLYPE